jgi:hypothetical protein
VSLDACLLEKLEVVDRGLEIFLADTVDLKSYGVLAGIKHTVFTCAIVLKLEKNVAVVKRINVFCFAFVDLFHNNLLLDQKSENE